MVDMSFKDVTPPSPYFEFSVNADSFQACMDICKPHNLFEKYNVTEIPDFFGLATEFLIVLNFLTNVSQKWLNNKLNFSTAGFASMTSIAKGV